MFNLFPRRSPSLPQNDDAEAARQRAEQLVSAQLTYQWTCSNPNLSGVPLSDSVPPFDWPTLPWFLIVGEAGLDIVENLLAVKLDGHAPGAATDSVTQRAQELRARVATLRAAYDRTVSVTDPGLLSSVEARVLHQHHSALYETLCQLRALGSELGLTRSEAAQRQGGLESYEALFKTLPLVPIADDFMEDEVFAYLRVGGPNPTLLAGVATPPEKFPLTDAQYQKVMGASDSLAAAGQSRRLYLLDYAELDSLVANPGAGKYVYAPIALFALPKGGSKLVPVAIQCGQDPKSFPMFLRASKADPEAYWGFQMAKTVVQVAEGNYHELFVHLARTHLVIEAFCVATHRNLAQTHPINILLLPHFEGSLFINNSAANDLIAPSGPIDQIFGATIEATQRASADDRLQFDFYSRLLPVELKARGVDNPSDLPDYPYRDDALLVWQAIAQWVGDYVAVYYQSDADVRADTELAAWCAALAGEGKIKGFGPITSRAQLSEVLTMVIFTASAQHAAVNFPQRPDMSYAPAISGAGWTPAPSSEARQSEDAWLKLLPPLDAAQKQLEVLYLLGSVHYRTLGEYRSNSFPYLPWFEDSRITRADGPLERFRASLAEVEKTIQARNRERARPYEFLLPSLIPPSINI